jgi:hypothetical protein
MHVIFSCKYNAGIKKGTYGRTIKQLLFSIFDLGNTARILSILMEQMKAVVSI